MAQTQHRPEGAKHTYAYVTYICDIETYGDGRVAICRLPGDSLQKKLSFPCHVPYAYCKRRGSALLTGLSVSVNKKQLPH